MRIIRNWLEAFGWFLCALGWHTYRERGGTFWRCRRCGELEIMKAWR